MYGQNPKSYATQYFDHNKVTPLEENFYDVIPSIFHTLLTELPVAGAFTITSEQYRPDLISWKIYKSVDYQNLLMEYNGLYSYRHLKAGVVLKYPSLSKMEALFLSLFNGYEEDNL